MTSLWQVFGERARFSELEPLGVIDIGSNSVRLVVYEGAVRAATPLYNEKVLCGLGRSLATTGKLGKDGVERALAALTRFRAIIRILGVKNVRAIPMPFSCWGKPSYSQAAGKGRPAIR